MQYSNTITLGFWERNVLFRDPERLEGGEKKTYPVPTYKGGRGIRKNGNWKPTFIGVRTQNGV